MTTPASPVGLVRRFQEQPELGVRAVAACFAAEDALRQAGLKMHDDTNWFSARLMCEDILREAGWLTYTEKHAKGGAA